MTIEEIISKIENTLTERKSRHPHNNGSRHNGNGRGGSPRA
jgi:hypothetical protein